MHDISIVVGINLFLTVIFLVRHLYVIVSRYRIKCYLESKGIYDNIDPKDYHVQ